MLKDVEQSPDLSSSESAPSSPMAMSTPASPLSPLDLEPSVAFPSPPSPHVQSTPPGLLSDDPMVASGPMSESAQASTSDVDEFVQHYDPTLYDSSEATSPLYEGSNVTVLEAHGMVHKPSWH